MDDETMIQHILSGDRRALHSFYHTYTPKLARFISAKINNPKDAEEILQDTLYAFLEAIRDFSGKAKMQTFLFSIASHKIVDFYRKKKIKHVLFSHAPQLESLMSPLLNPEEQLDIVILKEKIHKVLGRILPRYRDILLMKYIDGLSVGDIAQKFTVSFKSAESQLFRARKAFVALFLSI